MKHLVLGSEGQIGKYVCDEIEKNGDEVVRWDIKLDPLHDLRNQYHLSGKSGPALVDAMRGCDFVHFLAFDVGGSAYLQKHQNSWTYIRDNSDIMSYVFKALRDTGKPFYFASSQMANMTDSVYGQLKAVGESYTKALDGLNVQFWNVYGYESDPEKTHVITDFIKMALRDGHILCRTNGEEIRNWTHAEDAARILYGISQHYEELKKPMYMGIDKTKIVYTWPVVARASFGYRIRTVAELVSKHTGGVPIYYSDKEDKTQTIRNNVNDHLLHLLQEIIGFNDRDVYSLDLGIKNMVDRIKADGV